MWLARSESLFAPLAGVEGTNRREVDGVAGTNLELELPPRTLETCRVAVPGLVAGTVNRAANFGS